MNKTLFLVLLLVSASARPLFADTTMFEFEFEEIADGVWVGVRPDSPRFPVMGNATFVISDAGVVVFDGGGAPAMAEQVIDKIRSLTSAPVTHVVTSHWHGDHNFGVYRFGEEYPGVKFIAHRFTRDLMHSSRIAYIDGSAAFIDNNLEAIRQIVATGKDDEGKPISEATRRTYTSIIKDAVVIDAEYKRSRVTPPNVVIDGDYTIQSGDRSIEILFAGHGNTAGDLFLWLPEERIVAAGDNVVLPSPYAFNMPPRPWAATLKKLKALDYAILVPGHGPVQRDTAYLDLLIETAESIADQRDALLAEGADAEAVEAGLDFSAFEHRYTGGSDYIKAYYEQWFVGPFTKAAVKAATGAPMVEIEPPELVPFDDERWEIDAREAERVTYLGKDALRIKGGTAVLGDVEFRNGVIEYDIAISPGRGFGGAIFRGQDERNYEHFYMRSHQSGNPDANQYTPVFNGVSGWQLYHGEGYGAPVEYRFNEWMHVKIVVAGTRAEVYIDSDEPVLRIQDLKHGDLAGFIGLDVANFSAVHFADFRFTALPELYWLPVDSAAAVADDTLVTSWQVSSAFEATKLNGLMRLADGDWQQLEWTELESDGNGVANLARVQGLADGSNTAFARIVIQADRPETRTLSLGYSDAARVYLNGRLLYSGDNTYRSRDYRYLGTIGLFDEVPLPLEAGDNELWIAVTEAFGGWGVLARLPGP